MNICQRLGIICLKGKFSRFGAFVGLKFENFAEEWRESKLSWCIVCVPCVCVCYLFSSNFFVAQCCISFEMYTLVSKMKRFSLHIEHALNS